MASGTPDQIIEATQVHGPAVVVLQRGSGLLPALAVALKVPVLQLDAGMRRAGLDEQHLDLAGVGRVAFQLPLRADVPGDQQTLGRLEGQNPSPAALAAVDADVVHAATCAGLQHRPGDVHGEQVVHPWLDPVELFGEHAEGVFTRHRHGDVPVSYTHLTLPT